MPMSIEDRLDIHELLSLHGHLADDRQSEALGELLTADAVYDISAFGLGTVSGLEALIELFASRPGDQPIGHHVTNVRILEVDTTHAQVRSKGLSVMADGAVGTVIYEDRVTKTEQGWRIAYRKVVPARSESPTED